MEKKIKSILLNLGADICGIANVDRFIDAPSGFHPTDIYRDCKAVIVFAKCMPKGLANISPRVVYLKAGEINLEELNRIGYLASIEIERLGGIAVPIPSDSPYEYWDTNKLEGKGLISMRHAALLSGIGCMGKNTLIMNEQYGNMINIGAILANLDLKSDSYAKSICINSCQKCIDSCPQKALNGITVNQKLCREFTYSNNERGFAVCNCNICRIICPNGLGTN